MSNMDFGSWLKVSFLGVVSAVLAGYRLQIVLALAMAVLMGLDWWTGTKAAKKIGTYSTEAARNGLDHKKGELVVVIVAGVADMVLREAAGMMLWDTPAWHFYFLTLALVWYCFTEAHSNLENLAKMGVWVPKWFRAAVSAVITIVDKQGEEVADKIGDAKREQEGFEND